MSSSELYLFRKYLFYISAITDKPDIIKASDGGITLSLPIKIKSRSSGRKLISVPHQAKHRLWDTESTPLQSALARGHRWLQMLESGKAESLKEMMQLDTRTTIPSTVLP